MSTRLAGGLVALLASLALIAGCGGGDSSEATTTATPETVTVTAEAPVAEPVDVTTAEVPTDAPSVGDPQAEGMQRAIDLYKESLGLSESEARCVLDKAMKLEGVGDLSGPAPDMGALMGSGIMTVFSDCGIDFNTLLERMSQAG